MGHAILNNRTSLTTYFFFIILFMQGQYINKSRYELTGDKIGRGTFSKVYKGTMTVENVVAIKKINMTKIEPHKTNLDDEIRIMRSLKHDNIVNLLDVVIESDGQMFLVIEYCEDGDLKRYLKGRCMREKHAKNLLMQLMQGLKYLVKENNIMHRDLKPHNLLLTNNKQTLKISDFGFAKVLASAETMAETMCGTPYYMAPEIMQANKYQSRADLWSVGVITYEMFYGKYPFIADDGTDITDPFTLKQKIHSQQITYPVYPSETTNELSRTAVSLVKALLIVDPEKRMSWEEYYNHSWFYPYAKSNAMAISTQKSISSSPFFENTPDSFLNLVENYRSVSFPKNTPSIPPKKIATSSFKEYLNTSLSLAKDLF